MRQTTAQLRSGDCQDFTQIAKGGIISSARQAGRARSIAKIASRSSGRNVWIVVVIIVFLTFIGGQGPGGDGYLALEPGRAHLRMEGRPSAPTGVSIKRYGSLTPPVVYTASRSHWCIEVFQLGLRICHLVAEHAHAFVGLFLPGALHLAREALDGVCSRMRSSSWFNSISRRLVSRLLSRTIGRGERIVRRAAAAEADDAVTALRRMNSRYVPWKMSSLPWFRSQICDARRLIRKRSCETTRIVPSKVSSTSGVPPAPGYRGDWSVHPGRGNRQPSSVRIASAMRARAHRRSTRPGV